MAGAKREVNLIIRTQDKSSKAVDSVTNAFNALVGAQKNLKQTSGTVDSSFTRLGVAFKNLQNNMKGMSQVGAGGLGGLAKNVPDLESALRGVQTASQQFAQSMKAIDYTVSSFSGKLERARKALRKQASALSTAEAAHTRLRDAISRGEAANTKATASTSILAQKIASQESKVASAAERYADLSQKMGLVASPSAALAKSLGAVQKRLVSSVSKLEQMKAKYNSVNASIQKTKSEIARLTSELNKSGVSLSRQQTLYSQIATNVKKLEVSTAKATARQRQYNIVMGQSKAVAAQFKAGLASTAAAQERSARASMRSAAAKRKDAQASRLAMSWTQRLRGEVLTLAGAYVGLYGAMNLIKGVIKTYTTMESATSRLNAVMRGDKAQVAANLDMIRRTADRLGLSFGTLADEYSKIAASAMDTALAGEGVNKIFVRMAEASRVNKLDLEALKGAFMAVSQIITKGVVNMEELRQQLAERFPGAIQIMAKGLGYGADKMDAFFKAVANGDIKAEALLGFADELGERFSSSLPAAMATTVAQMGILNNELFKAQLAFGGEGAIEGFTELLKSLVKLMKDPAFVSFGNRVSKALGSFARGLGWVAENWKMLLRVTSVWLGLKLAVVVSALTIRVVALGLTVGRLGKIFIATRNVIAVTTTAMAAASAATRGFSLAIKVLMGSTGIGLIVVALTTALTYWVTSIDDATVALLDHTKVLDKVKNAYDEAKRKGVDWAEAVSKSLNQGDIALAESSIRTLTGELTKMHDAAKDEVSFGFLDTDFRQIRKRLQQVVESYRAGELTAKQFEDVVVGFKRIEPGFNDKYIVPLITLARKGQEAAKSIKELEIAVRMAKGTATEADIAFLGLSDAIAETSMKTTMLKRRFEAALLSLKKMVPAMKEQVTMQAKLSKIDSLQKELAVTGKITEEHRKIIRLAIEDAHLTESQRSAAKDLVNSAKRRAKAAKDFHETMAQDMRNMQFKLSISKKASSEQARLTTLRNFELKARKAGTAISDSELRQLVAITSAVNAQALQKEGLKKTEREINDLYERRTAMLDNLNLIRANGAETQQINETKEGIQGINQELLLAIDQAEKYWQTMGGEGADTAILKLQNQRIEVQNVMKATEKGFIDQKKASQAFASGFAGAMDSFAKQLVEGKSAIGALGNAFASFASDFLRQIAKMIIQQQILNMMQSMGYGGASTLGSASTVVAAAHSGGTVGTSRVGSGNITKSVNPAVFAGAARFHNGGIPGLSANEVPAILKKNEEVLREGDPRNVLNGGKSSSGGQQSMANVKVVNAIDSASFLSAALDTPAGEKIIMNYMSANATAVRMAIGA